MASPWTVDEKKFMQRALEVAERGRGKVSPNPLVGCILVKDGEVIAEGWHDHLGGLHAEQMAIHDAESNGHSPNGAVAYVTLEPCNHFGRTPPCTEALMWAGVKEVVVAHYDPNPTVRGKGIQVLQDAGIDVRQGLLEEEAALQMHPFLHWCRHRRPLVTVKMAVDANGSVDDRSQNAQRFTSDTCLDFVHALRKECDAVMDHGRVHEGNWGCWLGGMGKLKSFVWIGNKESRNKSRHHFNEKVVPNYLNVERENYEFEDYNFDHIFVCLSPQYTPKQHWHYFSMFISTFEEMTGKDAIIHTDKFQFHTNLDRVHNEILHQCSNGR